MKAGEREQPADDTRPPEHRRRVRTVSVSLVLLGVAALLAVVFWTPVPGWSAALHRLLELTFPVLLLAGGALGAYELVLRRWIAAELARIAGPRIVEALLPQQVMEVFLESIYGANDANRDVMTGVLGGEGRRPLGGDLTISTHTGVNVELRAVDHELYHFTLAVTYSFKKNVQVDRFIIFATCNALLRDSISSGCQLPLFELWFVPDSELFQSSVDDMLPSVRLGIEYLDHDDRHHVAESRKLRLREVKFQNWSDYLSFFREDMGALPRQSPREHLADLRIFECDLSDIADDDRSVQAIERLSVRATSLQRIDEGFCYWQAPYPCYVDRVTFAVKELDFDGAGDFQFNIAPFTFRSNTAPTRWLKAEDLPELEVRSWLLPGHGVVLLWRKGGG
ncbi:hypothetical protein LWP59_01025 [Amycolatopsis acidiphila]|uniref:hypothetical protein n=1 Tax=Amycolatopsis acidiphila TaxID=715473 RepID=UPI0019AADD93|nr:hypothetical protein [Amycolatopsis acidiphila]UIJ60316.1 hypothetical protein LWP59_01025 [Amycolatopsis acidiphila]GHG90728.1 hypothetical protein GCM10017788_66620 [Amycolatopsis acidiphila]